MNWYKFSIDHDKDLINQIALSLSEEFSYFIEEEGYLNHELKMEELDFFVLESTAGLYEAPIISGGPVFDLSPVKSPFFNFSLLYKLLSEFLENQKRMEKINSTYEIKNFLIEDNYKMFYNKLMNYLKKQKIFRSDVFASEITANYLKDENWSSYVDGTFSINFDSALEQFTLYIKIDETSKKRALDSAKDSALKLERNWEKISDYQKVYKWHYKQTTN